MIIDKDIQLKIKEFLRNLNCCNRCILRYFGYNQFENGCSTYLYPETEDIFSDDVSNDIESKRIKTNPCRACLDLLSNSTMESCVECFPPGFEQYDINEFTTFISLPISVSIREYSMFISLKDKFPEVYNNLGFSNIQGVKTVFKISCSDLMAEKLRKVSSKSAKFQVNININYKDEKKETENLSKLDVKKLNRGAVKDIFVNCDDDTFKKHFPVPPNVQNENVTFDITYSSSNLFLGGRYLKFSREMGQTTFIVNNVAITESSVQDILFESISKTLRCDVGSMTFSASGREDSDTRMLGEGRPFYIEIEKPKYSTITEKQCREIEISILKSDAVVVLKLQQVTQADTKRIKFGEQDKRKHYTALCKTMAPNIDEVVEIINLLRGPIQIDQTTPIRVLHRRSQMVRKRDICEIKASAVEGHPDLFYLHLVTQAGTYVKEFVHGDFNRTNPNLSKIISYPTDVLALDVTNVELEWP
ncbi:putative tRNA pseudouridine synthase Pus10 [Diorhabda carinulata]|uniref:putative tRNA pseudouridine synthase Pus10 n=1 Tax=Diorhabda carinulata TaxID=1163345 RepID=UPI0025A1A5B0|nr:putative tRNA pseudouridine synthase Pus10 [Diorhabda carinulata]